MAERPEGEGLVTTATGAAVLVAMLAFLPVVTGGLWWLLSALLVVVALAVATGARRLGLPALAASIVGLTTLPLTAALVVAGGSATASASPTAAANGVIDAIRAAFQQIYVDPVPAPGTLELGLLMALGAATVAVAAEFVTVGLRAPVAGVLVVVAVAIVPGKAFSTGTNGLLLVVVAAAALAVIAADRRRRGAAPRLGGLAAGGAIAIVLALLVQVVLPAPFASPAQAVGGPLIGSGANPLLQLGQDLRRGAQTPVLSYTSTGNAPVYLRLAVLEDFDGSTWAPNRADGSPLDAGDAPAAAGLPFSTSLPTMTTKVDPASSFAIGDRLPVPYPALRVSGVGDAFRWEDRGLTLSRTGGGGIGAYSVTSGVVDATPAQLRAASVSTPAGDADSLRLPSNIPSIIRTTAQQWTGRASTPYDEALAIQNQLRNGAFSYDENTPVEQGYDGDGLGVIAKFLQVKAGYCVHFASTMAVMARLRGIPARIVVGYQPGTSSAGTTARAVSSDDLHAWPELYFDGIGWVRFEPTPGRGAVPTYAPLPTGSASAAPSSAATAAATPTPTSTPTGGAAAADRQGGSGVSLMPLLQGAGGALGVLVLLALPGLFRRILRRRRLSRLDRDGAAGAWRELLDSVSDLGLDGATGRSPRGMEEALAVSTGPSRAARASLARLRDAYEHQAYSRAPATATAADVEDVLAALRDQAGSLRRVIAAVAPRSLIATLRRSRLAFGWSPSGSG